MKNIIPFRKDVIFKTNLSEITSISLENTLNLKDDVISGEFIVSGEYKISDRSTTVEPFEIKLPFEIAIDERYDTEKANIDIDDFYYEIVNNNVLAISIDVLIDHLKEKPIVELDDLTEVTPVIEILNKDSEGEENELENLFNENEERNNIKEGIIEEVKEIEETIKIDDVILPNNLENNKEEIKDKIDSIFNQISNNSEVYVTYNVYILRDGDSIDNILEKYNTTEEELKKYNDLSNLKLGDKIIIPNHYERD